MPVINLNEGTLPVARYYGVIMAMIGLIVVLLRGLKDEAGFDGTIVSGLCWMALLGAVGVIVGFIASQTVDESVRTKIEAELAAMPGAEQTVESTPVA